VGSLPGGIPAWASQGKLIQHYRKHWHQVQGVGSPGVFTIDDYDRSARETIAVGTPFTYVDRGSQLRRIGYYDRRTDRFTAVTEDGATIPTHYIMTESQIRGLLSSDYA
jgi:hypothetical protein